jgi:hypothetical protein
MGKKIKATPIMTIPSELQGFNKNAKFAYISLRNLFYAMHVCSVNAGIKGHDFSEQTKSILNSYIVCLSQNNIKLFNSDIELTIFADTLTSFNRNMLNKNEHIVLLLKGFNNLPGIDKYQVLMLFCHICLECSLQLGSNTSLTEQLVTEVMAETEQKMLINLGPKARGFIVSEICSIYTELN